MKPSLRINVTLAANQDETATELPFARFGQLRLPRFIIGGIDERHIVGLSGFRAVRGIDPRRCLGKVAADPFSEIARVIAAVSRIADPV